MPRPLLNVESKKNQNLSDTNYNKNNLTAKPTERARSCSPVVDYHESKITQKILPIINLEHNAKENTKNNNSTTTAPNLISTQLTTLNTQAVKNPLTTFSESLNVANTMKTAGDKDGINRSAIPKVVQKTSIFKPPV